MLEELMRAVKDIGKSMRMFTKIIIINSKGVLILSICCFEFENFRVGGEFEAYLEVIVIPFEEFQGLH